MKYRNQLPHTAGKICLTDGGLETVLVFEEGIDLPVFAAFTILDREEGRAFLQRYMRGYARIARDHGFGLMLGCPTWRANPEWGRQLGLGQRELDAVNARAVAEMERARAEHETDDSPMPISGCVGPRGDGYAKEATMSPEEAASYHDRQIRVFADSPADLVSALTLSHTNEAIGILRSAERHGMPAMISFTVETDGRLPSGERFGDAIERCDAETDACAVGYMINCAHPTHFSETLKDGGSWVGRLAGIRANASKKSHAELNESTELDGGNPEELGRELAEIAGTCEHLRVIGGCCGTDHRHIGQIARSLAAR